MLDSNHCLDYGSIWCCWEYQTQMWSDLIYSGYVRQQVAAVILMSFAGFCNVVKSCAIFPFSPPASVSIRGCHGYPHQATGSPLFPLPHLFTQFVILADLISRMSQILLVSRSLSATAKWIRRDYRLPLPPSRPPLPLLLLSSAALSSSPSSLHSLFLSYLFAIDIPSQIAELSLVTWLTGPMATDAYTGPVHSGTLRGEQNGSSRNINEHHRDQLV